MEEEQEKKFSNLYTVYVINNHDVVCGHDVFIYLVLLSSQDDTAQRSISKVDVLHFRA